jgi:hypothetical protein
VIIVRAFCNTTTLPNNYLKKTAPSESFKLGILLNLLNLLATMKKRKLPAAIVTLQPRMQWTNIYDYLGLTKLKKSLGTIVRFLTLPLLANTGHNVFCQDIELLRLPRFEEVSQTLWRNEIYYFPQFQEGTIIYQTGFKLNQTLKLNYNIYHERMEFIGEAGDTLGVEANKEIKLIEIGSHLFYHDYKSGFYEILTTSSVSLAVQPKFRLGKTEGNDGPLAFETRGAPMACDRFYYKRMSYFFIDVNDRVFEASKASVLKLFPEYKSDIRAYLIEKPVDFTRQEDMIRLTNYCYQLNVPRTGNADIVVKLEAGKAFPSGNQIHLYRFPEFQEAKIMWTNNSTTSHFAKLNYNLFTGKMAALNENADTVEFKEWREAKILNLDGDVFYRDFKEGYMEIILQGPLALAVRNRFTLIDDKETLEEAGKTNQAKASLVSNSMAVVNYDRLYKLEKTYFFLNTKYHAFEANKLSLFKLLPRDEEKIIDYLNRNSISFDEKDDLMSLITFCNQLVAE